MATVGDVIDKIGEVSRKIMVLESYHPDDEHLADAIRDATLYLYEYTDLLKGLKVKE